MRLVKALTNSNAFAAELKAAQGGAAEVMEASSSDGNNNSDE